MDYSNDLNNHRKSITAFIESKYGITLRPGQKGQCPKCHHKTLSVKKDDSLAKCFHPTCQWYIHIGSLYCQDRNSFHFHQILEPFFKTCHACLLELEKNKTWNENPYSYLTQERVIHPKVIQDSMIGAVPSQFSLDELFDPVIKDFTKKVKAIEDLKKHKRGPKGRLLHQLKAQLEDLQQQKTKFYECIRGKAGWICFFYTDQYHRITSFKLRQPHSHNFVSYNPGKLTGVFNHHLFSTPDKKRLQKDTGNLLVVEGEMNVLQLQSLAVSLEMGYTPACAVGGVLNADFETLRALSRDVTIWYDNDENKAGFALVDQAKKFLTIWAFTTPEKNSDADSFIRSFGKDKEKALKAIRKLIQGRVRYFRNYESIRCEIEAIRMLEGRKGVKRFQVNKQVADVICRDMQLRGDFYYDDAFSYYFRVDDKILVRLTLWSKELRLNMSDYGLNSTESIYHYVAEELRLKAWQVGRKVSVHKFAHYDKSHNILYVFNNHNQIYKITPDSIDLIDNGEDGVLFLLNKSSTPFKLVEIEDDRDYLAEELIKPMIFSSMYLEKEESETILKIWIQNLFFESISPTKALVVFLGPKGSGKSSFLRGLGQIFFGEKFNVSPVSRDERDFDATIVNNYLVCVDNADGYKPWLNDKLACVATGQKYQYRPLFKDITELLELEPHCFVGLTSRTPHFTRDDIVDRCLIFHVERLEGFKAEGEIQQELKENRDRIMSALIRDLQTTLKKLAEPWDSDEKFQFRMADFAAFATRIYGRDDMQEIFENLSKEQTGLAIENDPLCELIRKWVLAQEEEQWVTASELCGKLKSLAESNNIEFKCSPKSLGRKLNNLKKELEEQGIIVSVRVLDGIRRYYLTNSNEESQ